MLEIDAFKVSKKCNRKFATALTQNPNLTATQRHKQTQIGCRKLMGGEKNKD